MSKHTPGIWEVVTPPHGVFVVAGSYCVAKTGDHRTCKALDNARLIADAPTMLSLLERIYTDADEQDEGKGGRFSVELMEELRRFVKERQK